jgi:DNA repair protein RAD16
LFIQSQAQFNTYLVSGTVLNNYAHIFDILIRLRQAVDHPYLVIHSETQSHNLQSAGPSDSAKFECDLCREPLENAVQARCGHWFCSSCIQDYVASVKENATEADTVVLCPDCSSLLEVSVSTDDSIALPHTVVVAAGHRKKKSILNKVDLCAFQSSTKMEALMEVQ